MRAIRSLIVKLIHTLFSRKTNLAGCKGYLLWEIISPTMEEEALPIWAYHRAKITSVKLVVGKTGSRFIDASKRGHFCLVVHVIQYTPDLVK